MATYTNDIFNAESRAFTAKIDVYFTATPVSFYSTDYIMDMYVNEDVFSTSTNVLGDIAVNTLDIALYNDSRRFTPDNVSSPYYGKIVSGIKIIAYIKATHVVGLDWLPLGTFYMSTWKPAQGRPVINVFAQSKMQKVLDADSAGLQVLNNRTFKQLLTNYFSVLGIPAVISDSLSTVVPYGQLEKTNRDALNTIVQAAGAMCYADRLDNIQIIPIIAVRTSLATLTDDDQIKNVSAAQSDVYEYAGTKLTYYLPVLAHDKLIAEANELAIASGTQQHSPISFSESPVAYVENVSTQTAATQVKVNNYAYDAWTISINTEATEACITDLKVYGAAVDFTATELSDNVANMFEYANQLIQTTTYAQTFKTLLNKIATCQKPVITVEARGNLLLQLNTRVHIQSSRYAVDFDGIVVANKIAYTGGLACTMTLMDASLFTA